MIENEIIEETIYIEIETKPIAKGRPRFSRAKTTLLELIRPKKQAILKMKYIIVLWKSLGVNIKMIQDR